LACEVIRKAGNKVWGGVGVYTISELFFDGGNILAPLIMPVHANNILLGISPFLTEREVFDLPSRTARLCEAIWSYAH